MEDKTSINDGELNAMNQQEVEELLSMVEDDTVRTALKTKINTLNVQRIKNREKAAKLEAELAAKSQTTPQEQINKQSVEQPQDDNWRKKIEFITTKGRTLETDELEEVMAYAHGKGISYEEAMDSPFVKTALDVTRKQKQAEAAVVDTDSGKTEIERKFTPEQLRSMPLEELRKIIPQ